jgi:hypothetical protein
MPVTTRDLYRAPAACGPRPCLRQPARAAPHNKVGPALPCRAWGRQRPNEHARHPSVVASHAPKSESGAPASVSGLACAQSCRSS